MTSSRKPVRVAIVHYRDSAAAGGSLRVGETIANHLDPDRVSAQMVFAYGDAGPVAKRAKVPCHFIGARGPKDFPAWIRARRLFKELRPDIIHFQDGIVWLRTALSGTPHTKLVHVHARYSKNRNIPRSSSMKQHPFVATPLLRAFLKGTDAQVCISHGARNALLDLNSITPERSYVVYNSIDVSRFAELPDRLKAKSELGLSPDILVLGMICRLVWEKGCDDLLSVIERLPERWHGVICGEGPLEKELRRACAQRGVENRIHFIGGRDDVLPVYAAFDAYAFLSLYEPFGLVLAESMAAGIPVFGIQRAGEFNEPEYPLLRDDIVELIPAPGSENYDATVAPQVLDEVAATIARFGEFPESYDGMIARARAWVEMCFDAPVQAQAMTHVYDEICGRPSSQNALAELYAVKRSRAAEHLLTMEPQAVAVGA
jgi:glycosyltransferase involved in cell wall biosynthesis